VGEEFSEHASDRKDAVESPPAADRDSVEIRLDLKDVVERVKL